MTWIDRLNASLKYIEDHLAGELSVEAAAEAANASPFHFQRMFGILTDVTLAEYIRRRRLTLAAADILAGREILETALKYGYESQAAFTRAYHRMHGFTPGKTRDPGMSIKAYSPMSFTLRIQGVQSMNYEIRTLGEITLAGISRKMRTVDGENLREIPKMWEKVNAEKTLAALAKDYARDGILNGAWVGACTDFVEDQQEFVYMIGLEPSAGSDLSGMETRTIPPATWAVFPGKGPMPSSIQETWKRIFGEWFPATDYEHAGGTELEIYPDEADENGDVPYEVWIPVRKK
jgi:AraC family transcriptional regulator